MGQSQPSSRWIMILGSGVRVESLIPKESECKRLVTLEEDVVIPRGHRRPFVISLLIEIIVGLIEMVATVFETERV